MDKKKKSKKRIGKVNPLLYAAVYAALKWRYTRKYNISFDKSAVKDLRGPAIVVASHASDADHILSALTLYPVRPTYIVSEHFIHDRKTAGLIKYMHVITKKMFTADVTTVIKTMRARDEGAVIVIFPEGRLSAYGKTLPIVDGAAELIKKLGVDLYSWRAEGAYLTFPKWRNHGDDRPGRINAKLQKLLSADEVASTEISDLRRIVEQAVYNDDELSMAGVEYKCDRIAEGVENILFKCPVCMREDTIRGEGNRIRCECGLDATLDPCYRLHGAPFERINEWFDWQQDNMDTENGSLHTRATFGACGKDGFMVPNSGEGEIYIDKDIFRLSGTIMGEAVEYTLPTEKLGAFPITPGVHFDVYRDGELLYIYPEKPRDSIKWVSFLDNFMAKKRKNAQKAN